ncbi:F0F1 ATP synthase subunit A [Ferroacidibacillus organovorans]|uniref:ATP synthase subunit a n=1 Tax=Ferroacidibacillus organovorans TaxID=1765683 RepID=A0A170MY55_9BACL|nr:F0F1 ATP synthase subunit A [Ferroacidibacillus organovorans]KYP81457.1 ATP synthase F0 subunit A [Ferroacidibacillus organovorans]OAG93999.1 ATP synthase F0 subunit A [Ferroacidibacillus organovorans]OPG16728.1 ATP synthase F0 subunit A [Ferroacidibacillus organovorans]
MSAFPMLFPNSAFPINLTTIAMMILAGLVVIIFLRVAASRLSVREPGKMQNLVEWIIEFTANMAKDTMPSQRLVQWVLPLAFTMLLFLFVSNWLGVIATVSINTNHPIPWLGITAQKLAQAHGEVPLYDSPTANMSMTLGMAFMVWVISHFQGLKTPRKWLRHYKNPMFIIEEITNPLTHGMRLYGNIFAGEALIGVILSIPILYHVIPIGLPLLLVWLFYSAFVSSIQAYVFTILMTLYIGHKSYGEQTDH